MAVLLARMSGSTDIPVGTPVAGRGVRCSTNGGSSSYFGVADRDYPGESFVDLLGRVRQGDLDAFDHADVPFEQVMDQPSRSVTAPCIK